jgi:hypothetical protein
VVATATRNAPLLISGCAPLDGGNSEAGSALYGRTGFAGIVLTVTGNTTTNIEIRDFEISSINNFQADVCLQIGSAGNTLSNASGHSFAQNLRLSYCKHNLKFAGSVVSFQFDRIWMVMGNNGATSGANASCIEAVPNAEVLSELTFNAIACDGATNSDATRSVSTSIRRARLVASAERASTMCRATSRPLVFYSRPRALRPSLISGATRARWTGCG